MKPSDYICWTLRDRKNLRLPQMALHRSRGRGWIELADRGLVESVARPHHHRLLRRHPRHSRLRSPQVESWFRVFFFFITIFFHYKFERYASNMIGIFYCATAGFFFFFFLSWICVVGFGLTWMILFLARKKKKINFYVHSRIQYVFLFQAFIYWIELKFHMGILWCVYYLVDFYYHVKLEVK